MDTYLAVDWGTTNRRVYRIDAAGKVQETVRDDHGILTVGAGGYAAELQAIRRRMGNLPVVCAGMIGSNRGWREVAYVPAPCGIGRLATALEWIEPGWTAIVPGVVWRSGERVDVMRGEEVQLLGAVAGDLASADGLLCQPGTHCKWVRMRDGAIDRFATAITGEVFSLLKGHSLLGAEMTGSVEVGPAFLAGVKASADNDLLSRLFSVRADRVARVGAITDAASYVSGLLIGADVRARQADGLNDVSVLADPGLGDLYIAAVAEVGGFARLVDSHAAFVFGIDAIWRSR